MRSTGTVFGVTYNYTGYPLVRHARDMVANGELGDLRKVVVQYSQGWLATRLEESGNKQAEWRTDPARSGIAGAMGDIGSHAENLAATITGRHVTHVVADLATVVPGRLLDDDAAVLLRLDGGVRGLLVASQIEIGNENNIRIRVHGSEGSIAWGQEDPNLLVHAPASGPTRDAAPRERLPLRVGAEGDAHPAGPPRGVPRGVRERLPRGLRGDPRAAGRAASSARSRASSRRSRTARAASASSSAWSSRARATRSGSRSRCARASGWCARRA